MGKYAFAGAILLVMLAFYLLQSGPMASSPQLVTLAAGASANVGGGRATMWFAQPAEILSGGRIVTAASVSLTCKGIETPVTVVPGESAGPACGVRLKPVKMVEPGDKSRVFRATFEVTW